MPSGPAERYGFFLSRRGSVATIAQHVTDVLTEKGYRVFARDYDIPIAANEVRQCVDKRQFSPPPTARDVIIV
jgi:hypothetical protein